MWKVIQENAGKWLSAYTFFLEIEKITKGNTGHTYNSVAQILRGFNIPKRIKPGSAELEYFCPSMKY